MRSLCIIAVEGFVCKQGDYQMNQSWKFYSCKVICLRQISDNLQQAPLDLSQKFGFFSILKFVGLTNLQGTKAGKARAPPYSKAMIPPSSGTIGPSIL